MTDATPTTRALRILIVDDRSDILDLLTAMVWTSPGVELAGTAKNGQEAIDRARSLTPDVVIIDHAMPVMDGMTALPELRAILPDAALLLHTGYATRELEAQALAAGADAMIAKGSTRKELLDAIWKVVA